MEFNFCESIVLKLKERDDYMNYTVMSEEAIRFLCGVINQVVSLPTDVINNINLSDTQTFSNIHIKNLIDQCLIDANTEAQKLVGALTHLTCEETAVQPTLDNSQVNVIYLYSATGTAPYQQYLKISDTKLIDLGSTSISLSDYLTATQIASTYAKQVDLNTLTDEVNAIKDTIGTETLTTTSQTVTGAINELAGKSQIVTLTKVEYDGLSTKDPETYYVITDDEDSVSISNVIDGTSTNNEIPTAKATRDYVTGKNPSSELISECSNSVLKFPIGRWNIYSSSLARSLDDLPIQTGGNLEVFSTVSDTESPWTGTYRTRMYRYATYTKGEYIRYLYSGATPGVIEYDSGWQRVCTTKVTDVPITSLPTASTSQYTVKGQYTIVNGICYGRINIVCTSPFTGAVSDAPWISTDLPKPISDITYLNAIPWNSSETTDVRVIVTMSGALMVQGGTSGVGYFSSFSYPVAQ